MWKLCVKVSRFFHIFFYGKRQKLVNFIHGMAFKRKFHKKNSLKKLDTIFHFYLFIYSFILKRLDYFQISMNARQAMTHYSNNIIALKVRWHERCRTIGIVSSYIKQRQISSLLIDVATDTTYQWHSNKILASLCDFTR